MQYKGPVIWVCFKIYDSIMEWTVVCVCVCVCACVSHSVMSNSLQPHGLVDGQDPVYGTPQAGILEWVAMAFSR